MLVLSRRVGECVCIGDDIKVSIARIDGNQVRPMIDAPRSIPILREELLSQPTPSPQEKRVTSLK
jgi:carbon storage regulator